LRANNITSPGQRAYLCDIFILISSFGKAGENKKAINPATMAKFSSYKYKSAYLENCGIFISAGIHEILAAICIDFWETKWSTAQILMSFIMDVSKLRLQKDCTYNDFILAILRGAL
jgi:hypothetical protein